MARAEYRCTALAGSTKVGKLTPDENGYYKVVLGALNFYNSAGAYYAYEPAKHLFEESSSLMRRVNSGALRGEYGHPRYENGMTNQQFLMRVMDVKEQCVSHHIKRVWIDSDSVKNTNGSSVIAIMGMVKPMPGQWGDMLAASLANPDENVCFSIRSLTEDVRDASGTIIKTLREIITWDYVNEPGISVANKYQSPALESLSFHSVAGGELHSRSFDVEVLTSTKEFIRNMPMGIESDVYSRIGEAIAAFNMQRKPTHAGLYLPREANW